MSDDKRVRVDFVFDVMCTWSYLGYARLQKAVERYRAGGGRAEVRFRPFQLQPGASPAGEPLSEVHRRFFGPEAERKTAGMRELAAKDGLDLRFDRAVFTDTFEAHRLIAAAAAQGRGEEMTERLFRAYFTDGLNVADEAVLRRLAAETGVAWTDDGRDELRADLAKVRRSGVTAVPLFRFGDGAALSGAQPEETLLRALREAAPATV
ncbi:DsbA family oxidoreductase [Bailinhaonella thermotolerans]|uniref:DsbA family oxidoreductase n=1 Tax=Bailinhaonella thermotolerans TaxID=1070861 RepID=A0A3A4ASC1_9ACTN|nr:DsbA family oxidoreductase [Bailinhaonella thermotolerans]RJL32111.1 DsbA family oxidoreductase [Bailinhaonella thermotolerans]